MLGDFRRIHYNSATSPLQCILKSINYYLESMGKSIGKFDLPKLEHQLAKVSTSKCREITEEMSASIPKEDFEEQ